MKLIRFAYRQIGFLLLLAIGTPVVLLVGWVETGSDGVRWGPKIVSWMSATLLKLVDVEVKVDRPELLRGHEGFIFSNHTSYMDVVVMMAFYPVRYVGKNEIRRMFFVGRLAWAIGCIFVKRENKDSRAAVRSTLVELDSYKPAVVLYPEGRTAPIGKLMPFRKGAFEIAQDAGVPYLPVSMIYSDPHLVDWRSVSFFRAIWNIFSRDTKLAANMLVHDPVLPLPTDDIDELVRQTRAEMLETLTTKGNYQHEADLEPVRVAEKQAV